MKDRERISGLGKVYGFTLRQLYKNKSNLVSFGIIIAVALFAIPVMSFFMGSGSTEGSTFYTSVMSVDEFMNKDDIGFESRYAVQYAYSIIVMMVCLFAVTYIVRAILEEKSSKLVETLLVSIKSEDMILGKILAVITFIFSAFAAIVVSFVLSYFVTGIFRDTSFVAAQLKSWGLTSELLNLSFDVVGIAGMCHYVTYHVYQRSKLLKYGGYGICQYDFYHDNTCMLYGYSYSFFFWKHTGDVYVFMPTCFCICSSGILYNGRYRVCDGSHIMGYSSSMYSLNL